VGRLFLWGAGCEVGNYTRGVSRETRLVHRAGECGGIDLSSLRMALPGLRLPGGGLKSAPEITGADVVYDLRRFDLEHTVRWLRTVP
jgi:hypothetical protein